MKTTKLNEASGVDDLPGKPVSLWLATTPETDFPQLKDGLSVDVAIIGGISGITCALLLRERGAKVAVIEARRIVASVTGNTEVFPDLMEGEGRRVNL